MSDDAARLRTGTGVRGLVRTTGFRLTASYTLLFAVSALLLFGLIFSLTVSAIDQETDAAIDAEIAALAEQYDRFGLPGLASLVAQRAAGNLGRHSVYLLTDGRGRRLEGNLDNWPSLVAERGDMIEFPVESDRGGRTLRSVARARTFVLPGGFTLLVGRDLHDRLRFQGQMLQAMIWATGVMALVGIGGGVLIGWRSMRRLASMVSATDRVVDGGTVEDPAGVLAERIPVSRRGDELDLLAGNVNRMLDRLAQLLEGLRQVTDNVAHDLRGPLTRLKTRVEVTLLAEPDTDAYRSALEDTVAEANSLLATFNALLDIATAEAGSLRDGLEPVDVAALAADLVELYVPAAEEAGLTLHFNRSDSAGAVTVKGHPHLLGQAIANLIDNAVKYAGRPETPGRVDVSVRRDGPSILVAVADDGPGIPGADRQRAVDRFVRLSPDRSRPGNGLGLSLVAATVRLHGGRLSLEDNDPGLRVTLTLSAMHNVPLGSSETDDRMT